MIEPCVVQQIIIQAPPETFMSLLHDPAHWGFELFLMLIFDVIIGGLAWPFIKRHWNHHVERDEREGVK